MIVLYVFKSGLVKFSSNCFFCFYEGGGFIGLSMAEGQVFYVHMTWIMFEWPVLCSWGAMFCSKGAKRCSKG